MPDQNQTNDDAYEAALHDLGNLDTEELSTLRSSLQLKLETLPHNIEYAAQLRATEHLLDQRNALTVGQTSGAPVPTMLSAAPVNGAALAVGYDSSAANNLSRAHAIGLQDGEEKDYESVLDSAVEPEEKIEQKSSADDVAATLAYGGSTVERSGSTVALPSAAANPDDVSADDNNSGGDESEIVDELEPSDETGTDNAENEALAALVETTPTASSEPPTENNPTEALPEVAIAQETPEPPEEQPATAVAAPEVSTQAESAPTNTQPEVATQPPLDEGSDIPIDDAAFLTGDDETELLDDALETTEESPEDQSGPTDTPADAVAAAGGAAAVVAPAAAAPADPNLVQQIADRNDNGVVGAKEEDKFEEIADSDASGEVTQAEALAFDLIDTNDNGKIGKKELKAFRAIDGDKSGAITTEEATAQRNALQAQVNNLTKQEKRTLDLANSYLSKYGQASGGVVEVNEAAQALVSNNKTESSLKEKKKKK